MDTIQGEPSHSNNTNLVLPYSSENKSKNKPKPKIILHKPLNSLLHVEKQHKIENVSGDNGLPKAPTNPVLNVSKVPKRKLLSKGREILETSEYLNLHKKQVRLKRESDPLKNSKPKRKIKIPNKVINASKVELSPSVKRDVQPKVVHMPVQIFYSGCDLFRTTEKNSFELSREVVTGANGEIETVFTVNVSNEDIRKSDEFYRKIYDHILLKGGNDFFIAYYLKNNYRSILKSFNFCILKLFFAV